MQFDPALNDRRSVYKLLTGAVIPRPIGWISTLSEDNIPNLAPFSFFNVVGDDPPHVMFSAARSSGSNKDTLNNVLSTGQFVVNMVTEDIVEQMNKTSEMVAADVNEFELAGLTALESVKIKPFRVKESPITMECELVHHYELENHQYGGAVVIIGKIVMFHIDDDVLLEDFKIDMDHYKPVSRLAGANYSRMGEIFTVKRA
ncbi:flavin reductase family protein [Flavobacterium pallidum]|uniref:Flavin reductase like domain-containing protein n=1 Tax=Flavobacterium pallidum TaxID=2172098 RepID=A0A2S1SJA7_9FLAO|nr:flavin reductase family protein [Flavobacterium pallidum]AWI26461.1 hypothetical protein HYN49_11410 [Flavobacterium pallidum]